MEDQLNKIGFGKSKKKESMEEVPRNCKNRFTFITFYIDNIYFIIFNTHVCISLYNVIIIILHILFIFLFFFTCYILNFFLIVVYYVTFSGRKFF